MKAKVKEVIELFNDKIASTSKDVDETVVPAIDKMIKELEMLRQEYLN